MLWLGVISIALCAVQVLSLPLSNPSSEDDTKVMKCIVEVISGTLSKPNPIPISQDCLETLRADERIISILRHQNLLKELQELAAQGATERVQKQKKSGGFEDELSKVLERQNMKSIPSGKSEEVPAVDHEPSFNDKSAEGAESKRQFEEGKTSSEEKIPENSQEDENAEELESNEVSKREEASREEEIDNHITDEINQMVGPQEKQESEESEEHQGDKMSQKDVEIPEEDDRDESEKEDTNETDNEDDSTQREDNSKISEDDKEEHNSEADNKKEGESDEEKSIQEGGNSHQRHPKSDEETASKELEDSKRWNKMDELAKQLTSKKWVEENHSEEDSHQSMNMPPNENNDELANQESEDKRLLQQSREEDGDREPQISKRPNAEERKEEEGSANRKTEDQELESLAAIEAELEKVAHKLHELRRG
ncbi:chromogranin-A [Discoglossus pictus]